MFIFVISKFFVQLTKCEDTLLQQKAELIFRDNIPQWKVKIDVDGDDTDDAEGDDDESEDHDRLVQVKMAAQCSEGWRLEHLER